METFKYIHKPNFPCDDVLDLKYNRDNLGDRQVIYDSKRSRYLVFETIAALEKFVADTPEEDRCFHEVIFGFRRQKLKFDIDAPAEAIEALVIEEPITPTAPPAPTDDELDPAILELLSSIELPPQPADTKAKYILDNIVRAIKDAFLVTYQIDLDEVIVCESCGADKLSYHVIIDGYVVSDNHQAREFTKRVRDYVPNSLVKLLDTGVNKSLQNFRLLGCHKEGSTRVKTSTAPFAATLISNAAGCRLLPDVFGQGQGAGQSQAEATFADEDVRHSLKVCQDCGILNDHKFRSQRGPFLLFNRLRPTHCEFCDRVHHKDNTVRVTMRREGALIKLFKSCFHDDQKRSVFIGEFMSDAAAAADASQEQLASWAECQINQYIENASKAKIITLFDKLPPAQKIVYCEPQLRPFALATTLCVRAQMKMGKTKALHDYIMNHFTSLKPQVIRFISFRQTFSSTIKEKFSDFVLYSDVKGRLNQDKLIVQVESLHRLDITERPDLLVLDECESIFEQFESGLLRNFNGSFAVFQWLLKYSHHVVAMDANLGDRTYRILRRMRGGDITYHHNQWQNAKDDQYYFTADKARWLRLLYTALDDGDRIAVPMSSLTEAKALANNITKKYPNKSVKLYSSETPMSEKREHFSNVNLHWAQYDVLIYTPTVSAGISFERDHFAKVFGYFTDMSCPVETCQQMIGRIRSVTSHEFFIYLSATGNTLPTSIDEIKAALYKSRDHLLMQMDSSLLSFEYGPDCEIRYHDTDYFHMWLENTRMRNLSKNKFIERFMQLIGQTGAKLTYLTNEIFTRYTGFEDADEAELREVNQEHETAKSAVKNETCQKIAEAKELTDPEVVIIQDKIILQQDLTQDEKWAYEKYKIRLDYNYWLPITTEFVIRYRDPGIRRIFKNLTRISSCDSVEEALKRIQDEERANYMYVIQHMDERAQNLDLNRRYVFEQHRLALGLLKACGWNSITDPRFIVVNILAQNLRQNERLITDNLTQVCVEFRIKKPRLEATIANRANDAEYVSIMLGVINKVLATMYGVRICSRKEKDMFMLVSSGLFNLDGGKPSLRV